LATTPRLEAIFLAALELERSARRRFLDEACGTDAALRRDVESLLAADEEARDFLEPPPRPRDDVDPNVGRILGPWRLLRRIGRGGMGSVYLAHRADSSFEKTVAVKLIHAGLDTADVLRRFRNERQVLAALEHPNIARLLDGGAGEDGSPYLVMEHVEGTPIDRHCRENGLSVDARLSLFVRVCSAVQHAHRNLVVHRDIKPSNVLVTGDGEPKLLDFGIAKVLAPGGAPADATVGDARAMTPRYASPEQLRGEPVTTATDVYSLGVMLYELLAGQTPYRPRSESRVDLERAVLEQDPAPLPPAAGLSPDLGAVLLVALRKEAGRRYASVDAFAQDLARCIEGAPVSARRDSVAQRVARFVRRERRLAASIAALAVTLVGGFVGALALASRARDAEAAATRRFEQVRQLARTLATDAYDAVARVPGSTEARRTLVEASLRYLDGLAAEADGDAALLTEVGEGYMRAVEVLGRNTVGYVGALDEALAVCARFDEVAARIERAAPGSPAAFRARSLAAGSRCDVLLALGRIEDADRASAEQWEAASRWIAQAPADSDAVWAMALAHVERASVRFRRRDHAGVEADLLGAIARFGSLVERGDLRPGLHDNLRIQWVNLASARLEAGAPEEAMAAARRSVELAEAAVARDATAAHRQGLVTARLRLAETAAAAGDAATARAGFESTRDDFRRMSREDPGNLTFRERAMFASMALGDLLRDSGSSRDAIDAYREALTDGEALLAAAPDHAEGRGSVASVHDGLARAALLQKDGALARRHAARALSLLEPAAGEAVSNASVHRWRVRAHLRLAEASDLLTDPDARREFLRALAVAEEVETGSGGAEWARLELHDVTLALARHLERDAARDDRLTADRRADLEQAREAFRRSLGIVSALDRSEQEPVRSGDPYREDIARCDSALAALGGP
jgi:tetratricopeptide (TPR) repeat protein